MKRYIILFAIFITAIFFYPVFAYADRIGYFLAQNPVSEPTTLFFLGSGLLIVAGFGRRVLQTKK